MRLAYAVSLAALSLLVTAPLAGAFQIQSVSKNASDGGAPLTDPDSVTGNMAAHLTGGSTTGGNGSTVHIGNTTLSFSGGSGSNASTMSPALQERLMGGYLGSNIPNR